MWLSASAAITPPVEFPQPVDTCFVSLRRSCYSFLMDLQDNLTLCSVCLLLKFVVFCVSQ